MNSRDHTLSLDARSRERTIAGESDLVPAVRLGSRVAFAEIHTIYSRRLYRIIVGITKSPEDAEDALQETFLQAYLAIDGFEGRSSIYSWLTRIAINSALTILRKRRARPHVLFDPQPEAPTETIGFEPADTALNPEQKCDLHERQIMLLRAIRKLDPQLRRPIWMQMMNGWSMREISRALNISEAAVKARLHRARLRLSARRDLKSCSAYHYSLSASAKSDALLLTLDRSQISRKLHSGREGSSQSVLSEFVTSVPDEIYDAAARSDPEPFSEPTKCRHSDVRRRTSENKHHGANDAQDGDSASHHRFSQTDLVHGRQSFDTPASSAVVPRLSNRKYVVHKRSKNPSRDGFGIAIET
jgi:RNA polymerase sigma-70 factor (ECF subfamily)